METYALGVALAALAVAVIALLRSRPCQDHRSSATTVTRGPHTSPADIIRIAVQRNGGHDAIRLARRAPVLALAPGAASNTSEIRRSDGWFAMIPTACGVMAGTLVVVSFATQNLEPVSVRFLEWRLHGIPLAVPVLVSGVLSGVAVAIPACLRLRALRSRIDCLETRLRRSEEPERLPALPYIIGPRSGRRSPNAGPSRPA
jgi:uncharacterized integral membrane protein